MSSKKVHIEVSLLKPKCSINQNDLEVNLKKYLNNFHPKQSLIYPMTDISTDSVFCEQIDSITIDESFKLPVDINSLLLHFYTLNQRSAETEILEINDGNDQETPASNHWILPNIEFQGLWETLLYEDGIKENILKFGESAAIFGKLNVNKNIISCNRIIMLHGPPGTGKTSLCKAIAQKLSIRLNSIYKFTHFIEINSHSLFSKWFSESGKLVQQLFTKIKEMIMQPNVLVCVLIDEIESIAYDRGTVSGHEPKDSLRVVNAVLTQLDQIKQYPNVLILATSNLTSTIDLAFIDRIDIKQFIGLPTTKAIYEIYSSTLNELMRVGLIEKIYLIPYRKINELKSDDKLESDVHYKLLKIAEKSVGLSGRTLRKIPFLAHALYSNNEENKFHMIDFLAAMNEAVKKHLIDEKSLKL